MAELVEIWMVPLDRSDRELRGLYETLSRRSAAGGRAAAEAAETMVRRAAGRAAGDPLGSHPDAGRRAGLVRSEGGKPALAGEHELSFSVSDSGDLALVALARRDVGVDVERVRDRPVAARAATLGIEGFFERWARFEAAGKARGTGIAGPAGEDGLACASLDVGSDYAAAVAVAAERVAVRLRPY